jgi:hypothetical protein
VFSPTDVPPPHSLPPPPLCFCCAATRSNSFCAFTRQYLRASFPSQICPHRFFFGHLFTLIPPKCNFYLANMPLSVRRRLFVQRSSYTPPYIQFSLLGFFLHGSDLCDMIQICPKYLHMILLCQTKYFLHGSDLVNNRK